MTRREQWISFYTAALAGTADPRVNPGEEVADCLESAAWAARQAETVADEAMARLDARAFPKPKIASLLEAANAVWGSAVTASNGRLVRNDLMAALGKAVTDFEEQS
jgi:hypothetical protein